MEHQPTKSWAANETTLQFKAQNATPTVLTSFTKVLVFVRPEARKATHSEDLKIRELGDKVHFGLDGPARRRRVLTMNAPEHATCSANYDSLQHKIPLLSFASAANDS